MKKFIFSFLVMASVFTTASFAQEKTPGIVIHALENKFTGVKQASWAKVSNLYKAEFTFQDAVISAFFDADGDLVATGRDVEMAQLPIDLQLDLKKHYSDYSISKSFEVDMQGEATYYLVVESATKKLQLQSTAFNKWEAYLKPAQIF